jgi:hypothetical protein
MIFSASDFTMDQMSLDCNKERSIALLPLKLNGWNKIMGAHDRIPPDPANSRYMVHWHICRQSLTELTIKKDRPQEDLHLHTRGTLGQPPLLGSTVGPHATARWSTSSAEEEAATDHRPTDESSEPSPNTEAWAFRREGRRLPTGHHKAWPCRRRRRIHSHWGHPRRRPHR